ncbi:MAG: hypothetical protein JW931_02055 [Methanomicrobiaceae archaeon]|nr:hypothetical protein [Methanomicrobiaceae archaeon]
MENLFRRYIQTTFLLIIILIIIAPAQAGSQWETKEIHYDNQNIVGGYISGEYIIILTSEGINQTGNRINLYSIKSGDSINPGKPSKGMTVTGEAVSGDYAVWFETQAMDFETNESDTLPNSIYLMDI